MFCSTYKVLCLLSAPICQRQFLVGLNLLGNKNNSDSDSDSDSTMKILHRNTQKTLWLRLLLFRRWDSREERGPDEARGEHWGRWCFTDEGKTG